MELLLTFLVGFCMVIGSAITFITKNNDKFLNYSTSICFGVIFALILLELIPESLELIGNSQGLIMSIIIFFIFAFLGIGLLKLLDHFLPDHHLEKENSNDNYLHLAIITSIALIIHNILEGMAVYTSLTSSLKLGIPLCIGVGLHNIPLGMSITSYLYKSNNNIVRIIISVLCLSLTTLIGGLILVVFKDLVIKDIILGILLSVTSGMLIYISLFELLPHLNKETDKKNSIIGICIGILILLISLFFE